MDQPTRTKRPKNKAPDADRGSDSFELKLAEYSAPFGEEHPWRIATDELELETALQSLRLERGRLH